MTWARLGADLRFSGACPRPRRLARGSAEAGNPRGGRGAGGRARSRSASRPSPINAKFALKLALADLEDLAGAAWAARSWPRRYPRSSQAHELETSGPRAPSRRRSTRRWRGGGFDERFAAIAEGVTAPQIQAAVQRQITARRVAIVRRRPEAATFVEGLLSSETMIEYRRDRPGTYRARDLGHRRNAGACDPDAIEIRQGERSSTESARRRASRASRS